MHCIQTAFELIEGCNVMRYCEKSYFLVFRHISPQVLESNGQGIPIGVKHH
jgi:hypothetical protein